MNPITVTEATEVMIFLEFLVKIDAIMPSHSWPDIALSEADVVSWKRKVKSNSSCGVVAAVCSIATLQTSAAERLCLLNPQADEPQ